MGLSGLMTTSIDRVDPAATLTEVCRVMDSKKVGAVAVVEDHKLCGVLTYRDLQCNACHEVQGLDLPGPVPDPPVPVVLDGTVGDVITGRPWGEDGVGIAPTGIVRVNERGEPVDDEGNPVDVSRYPERAAGHVTKGGTIDMLYNPSLSDRPVERECRRDDARGLGSSAPDLILKPASRIRHEESSPGVVTGSRHRARLGARCRGTDLGFDRPMPETRPGVKP